MILVSYMFHSVVEWIASFPHFCRSTQFISAVQLVMPCIHVQLETTYSTVETLAGFWSRLRCLEGIHI